MFRQATFLIMFLLLATTSAYAKKDSPPKSAINIELASGEQTPDLSSKAWQSVPLKGVDVELAKSNIWIRTKAPNESTWSLYGPLNDGDTVAITANDTTYYVPITIFQVNQQSEKALSGFRIKVRVRIVIRTGGSGSNSKPPTPPVIAGLESDPTQTDVSCQAPIRAFNRDPRPEPVTVSWVETVTGSGPGSCNTQYTSQKSIALPKGVHRRVFCGKQTSSSSFCVVTTTYKDVRAQLSATGKSDSAKVAPQKAKSTSEPKGRNDHGGPPNK